MNIVVCTRKLYKTTRMIRLFTVWYEAGNAARQAELLECLQRNLSNPFLGQLLLWKHLATAPSPKPDAKLIERTESRPPTFDDFFDWANAVCTPGDVAVIANTDVWFDDSAALAEKIAANQFFALVRWESDGQIFSSPDGKPRPDSQDAWIFRTPIRPPKVGFGLGVPRNDNALAYLLWRHGFDLRNPGKSIHIHHLHSSGVRPAIAKTKKYFIPPPWLHMDATEIHERGQIYLLRKTWNLKWQFRRLRRKITGR